VAEEERRREARVLQYIRTPAFCIPPEKNSIKWAINFTSVAFYFYLRNLFIMEACFWIRVKKKTTKKKNKVKSQNLPGLENKHEDSRNMIAKNSNQTQEMKLQKTRKIDTIKRNSPNCVLKSQIQCLYYENGHVQVHLVNYYYSVL